MERARFCPTAVNATWGNCERLLSDGVKSDRIGLGIGRRRAAMEQYVGLDISLKETSLCVVDQTGTTLWQGRCASTPESIAAVLARRAPERPASALRAGCCRPGTGTR